MLISGLKNKGYMELGYIPYYNIAYIHFDYIWVPFLLLEEFPEYSRKEELKKELQNVFAERNRTQQSCSAKHHKMTKTDFFGIYLIIIS